MKGESGLFRIFVILFVGLVVITGVVYFSLLIFDAEPTRYRRVLYSFMPNFRAVEFVATVVQVNSKKNTVDIKVQDNRYTLNLRPYTYYYKPGPHPEISKSGDINLKPVSRLM